jgi:hypothetical protein
MLEVDGLIIPPAGETEECDRWGNLRGEPYQLIDERHGDFFIRIMIYRRGEAFYYGYQLRVGTMIRQRAANMGGEAYRTPAMARMAASIEIEALCGTNKNVKKLFTDFTRIRYNQGSLFEYPPG